MIWICPKTEAFFLNDPQCMAILVEHYNQKSKLSNLGYSKSGQNYLTMVGKAIPPTIISPEGAFCGVPRSRTPFCPEKRRQPELPALEGGVVAGCWRWLKMNINRQPHKRVDIVCLMWSQLLCSLAHLDLTIEMCAFHV